jgi:hypothetical protein
MITQEPLEVETPPLERDQDEESKTTPIAGSLPRTTRRANATAAFGDHFGKLIIRSWILGAPTAKKIDQVSGRLARRGNGHDSCDGAACLCQDSRFASGRDLFHQLGESDSRILNGHDGFAHKSILLPTRSLTQVKALALS